MKNNTVTCDECGLEGRKTKAWGFDSEYGALFCPSCTAARQEDQENPPDSYWQQVVLSGMVSTIESDIEKHEAELKALASKRESPGD